MKKLIMLIFMSLNVLLIAQTAQVKILTIADGDSISSSIVLKDEVVPIAVWVDSLTTNTTLKLQVGFNYSTTTAPTTFYDITSVSDSTVYSINLRTNRVIPLEPKTFLAMMGTTLDKSTHVWIRVVLGAHQDYGKYIYTRLW